MSSFGETQGVVSSENVSSLRAGFALSDDLELRLTGKTRESESVVSLRLARSDGGALPVWTPGSHVDLLLPNGIVRQYSLCGDPSNTKEWRFGVLREEGGRGGSAYIHDRLQADQLLKVRGPRNNFHCEEASKYIFIAGGIGITPILPMIAAVNSMGADWSLIYGGRWRQSMAFTQELAAYGDRVSLWPQDECGLLDLEAILDRVTDLHGVYCCGPEPLITAVEQRLTLAGRRGNLHVERFKAVAGINTGFDLVLARSKRTLHVPADQSILDVCEQAGLFLSHSCRIGICGTCETAVVSGRPDHRDQVLSNAEHAANKSMMICVSRSLDPLLELDI